MGRRKDKPRLIPEQDKRICRAICLCQLTMVLSCVSIVYLSVAIYSPSFKAFKSGFELDPVMCQTHNSEMPDSHCAWASCGEWCLTRTSGFCPQIYSTVRRNGTDVQFNNCSKKFFSKTTCPMPDMKTLAKFNCNNGTECNHLKGVFNCTNGHCRNMTQSFLCHHKADGPVINSAKDNTKLNGFFECKGIHCTKIRKPFTCDRICNAIGTSERNVMLMEDNSVITADCENAVAFNEARGNEPGVRIDPTEFWKQDDGVLLANCASVTIADVQGGRTITAKDCINGTLLPPGTLPNSSMNFTDFWKIYAESKVEVDPEQRFLPNQHNLTIYKSKKLFINLEGCVNTLRGECKEFWARHGADGDNNTAMSRYQCYYNKDPNVEFVTARYDLKKVYNELMISLILPIVLFVISSISLIVITKLVKVGDDAKMRCICAADNDDTDEIYSARKSVRARQKETNEANENLNQLSNLEDMDISPSDTQGMIGSTKYLLPQNATNESANTDHSNDDEKALTCDVPEKPLVVI
ncbi:uncharacterized protein LOC101888555 isoform X1 [Musca domestica]|uniref:Uncharacterized protein LOC101888555 n=1 Tax=Musca domestica TaxID=7370 RepID=A0A1I8MQ41_MUSDO|nr:uncharacterized protein LOC101888555 isoform X1 [Musca domestica]